MGRKKKEEFASIEDRLDDAIGTYLTKGPGHLSLEQTAVLLWQLEGRKTEKPMTKMGILKIEQNALLKLRVGLKKYGINHYDDVFDPNKFRSAAVGVDNSVDGD